MTALSVEKKGHLKFARHRLKNSKKPDRDSNMECIDCNNRHKEILNRLRAKISMRCTCPGKQATRQHVPKYIKCELFPLYHGDKRWPGKNNEVTLEDFQFHERMTKRGKS